MNRTTARLTGITVVGLLSFLPANAQAIPDPGPGHGELSDVILLTNKSSKLSQKVRPLADTPYFSISIEGTLAGTGFTASDVQMWAEAELARSAPAAKVVTKKVQENLADKDYPSRAKSALGMLRSLDAKNRSLVVSVLVAGSESSEFYGVGVSVKFLRPAIQPYGFASDICFTETGFSSSSPGSDNQDKLREAVQSAVRKFADNWVVANRAALRPLRLPSPDS